LLRVAADTKKDMVSKYVLLAQAKEIAIGSGDPPTAFHCLDELGRSFAIDYPSMKVELFTSLSATVNGAADCQTVTEGLIRWADGQVKADRYDVARRARGLAVRVARRNQSPDLIKRAELYQHQIEEIEAAFLSVKLALSSLADKPDDPTANLAVGRFYCLMKGDWGKGLPMLAKGSDQALKALAEKEVAGASDAEGKMAVGDGWWNLAEKSTGVAKDRIREHANEWYRKALPGLEGLAKAKIQKRLESPKGVSHPRHEDYDNPLNVIRIDALVDGNSELHITPEGIYWKSLGVSKPGRHSGNNLPTYVNGTPWMPQWHHPEEEAGYDQTKLLKLTIGKLNFNCEVVAVGGSKLVKSPDGIQGIEKRDPVTISTRGDEQVVSIPDHQSGSKWYRLRLFRME
jgi:hypothetical protein